jgi:hypothetical protein
MLTMLRRFFGFLMETNETHYDTVGAYDPEYDTP